MLNTEPKKPRVTATNMTTSDERTEESVSVLTEAPEDQVKAEDSGSERLKRHRMEMAGRVWIPEIWGQESFLKDWVDCSAFDSSLVPKGVVSARQALVEDGRRANSARGLRIENRC